MIEIQHCIFPIHPFPIHWMNFSKLTNAVYSTSSDITEAGILVVKTDHFHPMKTPSSYEHWYLIKNVSVYDVIFISRSFLVTAHSFSFCDYVSLHTFQKFLVTPTNDRRENCMFIYFLNGHMSQSAHLFTRKDLSIDLLFQKNQTFGKPERKKDHQLLWSLK